MTWYNPKTWRKSKKVTESIYLRVVLDGPITGVSRKKPERPYIFVTGVSLEDMAGSLPRIDWHTVPMAVREKLELQPYCLEVSWDEAQKFLRGQ